jgi:transaldolase
MNDNLQTLAQAGVAIWLDDISRPRLTTGNLAELVREKGVVGVTSNPTIFAKALSEGDAYNEQLRTLAANGTGVDEAVRTIITDDIRDAADVLKQTYDAGGGDGMVSIEVDPRLAHDTDGTIDEAATLNKLVGRPNVFIKIPATKAGLPAITATLAAGINVNVTLIFSLERYRAVMDAWLAGVEQARDAGHDVTTLISVASFFVSRVDSEVDKRLDKVTGHDDEVADLRAKAAIANARLAFAAFEEVLESDRWKALEKLGVSPQRPLWASTSTKDPDLPDTLYVTELVTKGVVNTMPEATIDAFADHGQVTGDTVRGRADEAQAVLDRLEALGIGYDDVVQVLEDEGVEKFAASWNELLETVSTQLSKAGASV